MHRSQSGIVIITLIVGSIAAGCGSSIPPPRQALVDAQAAERAAAELGAQNIPDAQLHLTLAREHTNRAQRLMNDGDNKKAADELMLAKVDAELALALTQEVRATSEAQQAIARAQQSMPQTQGQGQGQGGAQ